MTDLPQLTHFLHTLQGHLPFFCTPIILLQPTSPVFAVSIFKPLASIPFPFYKTRDRPGRTVSMTIYEMKSFRCPNRMHSVGINGKARSQLTPIHVEKWLLKRCTCIYINWRRGHEQETVREAMHADAVCSNSFSTNFISSNRGSVIKVTDLRKASYP